MSSLERTTAWLFALLIAVLSGSCTINRVPSGVDEAESGACGDPTVEIAEVQGSTSTSPLRGQTVEIEGVITAVLETEDGTGTAGVFVQRNSLPGDVAATASVPVSDAVLVLFAQPTATDAHAVGQLLRVRGEVDEVGGMTTVTASRSPIECGRVETTAHLVREVTLDANLEDYEAALVRIEGPLTLVESYGLSSTGRMSLASGGRLFSPTNSEGGERPEQRLIELDDNRVGSLRLGQLDQLEQVPRLGDQLSGLVGVLAEEDGAWLIHPRRMPAFTSTNPRPEPPPPSDSLLRVAAVNLHNYFTTFGVRGAVDSDQLIRQETKLVAELDGLDAAIVGLVELENNSEAERRLTDLLNRGREQPFSIVESSIDRLDPATADPIRVGMIYRSDLVEPVGDAMLDPAPVFRRPLLGQAFRFRGRTLVVIVVHLKSKGCGGAAGADLDQGDGHGCWNQLRVRQAEQIVRFVAATKASAQTDDVVVVGDFNCYAAEDPIDVLSASGLVDEVSRFSPDTEPYSFVFRGRAGLLDYAMTTPSLSSTAVRADIWHVNADELVVLDYSGLGAYYQPTPYRSSDHDPVYVDFDFGDRP